MLRDVTLGFSLRRHVRGENPNSLLRDKPRTLRHYSTPRVPPFSTTSSALEYHLRVVCISRTYPLAKLSKAETTSRS
jgi:hypothetical protein